MKWGRKWGNIWGSDAIPDNKIKITDMENSPPEAIVSWPEQGTNSLYHVYVDGKLYSQTTATSILVQLPSYGRHWFQIIVGGPASYDENLSAFATAIPGGRAKLTWDESGSTDIKYYAIYYDAGLGGALSYLGETKGLETEWISEELSNGTYIFRVDPVDRAENRKQSSSTTTVTIAKYPNPPSGLEIESYDEDHDLATFSFVESEMPPTISGYHVYHNSGSGYIDYSTVQKNVASGENGFTLEISTSGKWAVGIRSYNSSYEEDNVDVFVEFELSGSPIDLLDEQPNIPGSLDAIPSSGGTFELQCSYLASEEKAKATAINFYADNGLGGEINYTSAVASGTVEDHTMGENSIIKVSAISVAMVDGRTYTFSCKASSATGRESDESETTTGICDATVPDDISNLAGEAVNYDE